MGVVRFLSVHCREQVFVSFFLFLDPRYVQFIVRLEVRKESFYLAKRQRLWWRGRVHEKTDTHSFFAYSVDDLITRPGRDRKVLQFDFSCADTCRT